MILKPRPFIGQDLKLMAVFDSNSI